MTDLTAVTSSFQPITKYNTFVTKLWQRFNSRPRFSIYSFHRVMGLNRFITSSGRLLGAVGKRTDDLEIRGAKITVKSPADPKRLRFMAGLLKLWHKSRNCVLDDQRALISRRNNERHWTTTNDLPIPADSSLQPLRASQLTI